jgi:hypothetical protein
LNRRCGQILGRADAVADYGVVVNGILAGLAARAQELEGAPLVGDKAWGRAQENWEKAYEEAEAWEEQIASAEPPKGLEELHKCVVAAVKDTVLGHQRMHQAAALAGLHYLTVHTWLHLAGKTASLLRSRDPALYARLNLSREVEAELSNWSDPKVGLELGIY